MNETPRGLRLHIGIFGKRNAGKSSLLNALTGQETAIVSPLPGTTTDVVQKPMELKPLGPVLFLDTAGLDDCGELGAKRVAKSYAAMDRTDLALLVSEKQWGENEVKLAEELKKRNLPTLVIFTKSDLGNPAPPDLEAARQTGWPVLEVSARSGAGLEALRQCLVQEAPKRFFESLTLLGDLIGPGDTVVLVVPIDLEAPKGRLILPQVQMIREVLDCDARALVVKERELLPTLSLLRQEPKLVITDSQAILKVSADVPQHIPVTGFSVLLARWKGDLEAFVRGALAVDSLHVGDSILILESCGHHPIGEDIGRVKIPRWLSQYVGGALHFEHCQGHDFPADLSKFKLVIHCGACMTNRQEVLTRILRAQEAGVPITNYGLVIAKSQGVLARMLSPFPGVQALL